MPCEGGEEEGEDVPGQLGRGGGAHVRLGDLHLAFQDREEGELHGHVDQGGDDGEEKETEVLTTQKEHIFRPKNEFCLWVYISPKNFCTELGSLPYRPSKTNLFDVPAKTPKEMELMKSIFMFPFR